MGEASENFSPADKRRKLCFVSRRVYVWRRVRFCCCCCCCFGCTFSYQFSRHLVFQYIILQKKMLRNNNNSNNQLENEFNYMVGGSYNLGDILCEIGNIFLKLKIFLFWVCLHFVKEIQAFFRVTNPAEISWFSQRRPLVTKQAIRYHV